MASDYSMRKNSDNLIRVTRQRPETWCMILTLNSLCTVDGRLSR